MDLGEPRAVRKVSWRRAPELSGWGRETERGRDTETERLKGEGALGTAEKKA